MKAAKNNPESVSFPGLELYSSLCYDCSFSRSSFSSFNRRFTYSGSLYLAKKSWVISGISTLCTVRVRRGAGWLT